MAEFPLVDWFWNGGRFAVTRAAIAAVFCVGAGRWLSANWQTEAVQRIAMPVRATLDKGYARHVAIPQHPAWIQRRGARYVLTDCPADFPVELTTRRPFQQKGAVQQRWRLDPVGADRVRLRWQVSSRWDGRPEHRVDRILTRKALKSLNGGDGLVLWQPGDDANTLRIVNPLVPAPVTWTRIVSNDAILSPFNQWERQVAGQNCGESSATAFFTTLRRLRQPFPS